MRGCVLAWRACMHVWVREFSACVRLCACVFVRVSVCVFMFDTYRLPLAVPFAFEVLNEFGPLRSVRCASTCQALFDLEKNSQKLFNTTVVCDKHSQEQKFYNN